MHHTESTMLARPTRKFPRTAVSAGEYTAAEAEVCESRNRRGGGDYEITRLLQNFRTD